MLEANVTKLKETRVLGHVTGRVPPGQVLCGVEDSQPRLGAPAPGGTAAAGGLSPGDSAGHASFMRGVWVPPGRREDGVSREEWQ